MFEQQNDQILGCGAHVHIIALPHVRCACGSACGMTNYPYISEEDIKLLFVTATKFQWFQGLLLSSNPPKRKRNLCKDFWYVLLPFWWCNGTISITQQGFSMITQGLASWIGQIKRKLFSTLERDVKEFTFFWKSN